MTMIKADMASAESDCPLEPMIEKVGESANDG
jgi:hypothetical protein